MLVIGVTALLVAYWYRHDAPTWMVLSWMFFGVLGVLASVESWTSFLYLGSGHLKFRENFKSTKLEKTEIEKATWEKGCGVSIQLFNGSWVPIPGQLGTPVGIANSIRAWLEKA